MKIIEKLKQDIFTGAEKEVVNFIIINKDNLSTYSINDIAKETYTSNATIIRVCHKLDFKGYKQFKVAFIKEREADKYQINEVDYTTPFHHYETSNDIMQNMYSLYQESIKSVHSSIDVKTINSLSSKLLQAKRIFIFAYGDAKITAMAFINKLIKIGIFPILATENHEELYVARGMNKDDFALFISYGGKNKNLIECMSFLSNKNISSALITANEESILMKYSQIHICIPDLEKDNKIATYYSQLSFQYVLTIIYSIIYKEKNIF